MSSSCLAAAAEAGWTNAAEAAVAGWVKLAEKGPARPSARMILLSGYGKDNSYDHTWVPPGLQVSDASLRLALILSQMTDITTLPPEGLRSPWYT
jgi:hypothetical protein